MPKTVTKSIEICYIIVMAKDINKKSLRFSIYVYIELISAILFTLFSFSAHADISLIALPVAAIYTAITVYFSFF